MLGGPSRRSRQPPEAIQPGRFEGPEATLAEDRCYESSNSERPPSDR